LGSLLFHSHGWLRSLDSMPNRRFQFLLLLDFKSWFDLFHILCKLLPQRLIGSLSPGRVMLSELNWHFLIFELFQSYTLQAFLRQHVRALSSLALLERSAHLRPGWTQLLLFARVILIPYGLPLLKNSFLVQIYQLLKLLSVPGVVRCCFENS